jgi:hypothetical protein
VSISELVKEVLFVLQILESMKIKVELPVKIYNDNMGAINMVRNNAPGTGTRHVNVRYHFTRELHESVIMLHYRETQDNEADMMTKNATHAEFVRHTPKLVAEVPEDLRAKVKKQGGC